MKTNLLLSSLFLFLSEVACGQPVRDPQTIKLDELMIDVPRDSSREVAYTNKQTGVFYTETNGEHRSAWQGWRIMSQEMMEDYTIAIDGQRLRKSDATARVYPHQLVRQYPTGVEETITLLDSIDAVVIELNNLNGKEQTLRPCFSDSPNPEDYVTEFEQNVLFIARKRHLQRTPHENYPVWIGLTFVNEKTRVQQESDTIGQSFSPALLQSQISNHQSTAIFVVTDTRDQVVALAHRVLKDYPKLIAQRKARMEAVLNRSYVRTDNPRFDKALNWAKLSLDALIMNRRGKGIFAGLPWFDNYWGRDTFISLPALLVMGDFEDAKEILKSFAEWQEKDSTSTNYGRIPNLVTNTSIAYNTADGTPRFVMALNDYLRYTGDREFAREMYPIVKRSIEGTIKYHTDSLGFLTHGDAETWMDAVGPEGPWSPHGNRANDVQALWEAQLLTGLILQDYFGDWLGGNRDRWRSVKDKLEVSFQKYFIDPSSGNIHDCLRSDGSPSDQFRPNQIFTLLLIPEVAGRESVFRSVTEQLVYPYGVASLSQDDDDFHPYHHYSPYYVQDAAYHNGIVWTWLAGAWIDAAVDFGRSDLAWQVTDNMVHQILDRGAVGTLSELVDAAPRSGEKEPRLSGTYSQAWSLAEFIRTFYQKYLGAHPGGVIIRFQKGWFLSPHLPGVFHQVRFLSTIQPEVGMVDCRRTQDGWEVTNALERSAAAKKRTTTLSGDQSLVFGGILHGRTIGSPKVVRPNRFPNLHLATPHVRPNLKALQGPSHRLLTNGKIKQSNPSAKILFDVSDPEGDDTGPTGTYVYPQATNLKSGSLDITHFTVRADEKNVYFNLTFRNLSNPGWHPEYGFQLTYAAIAIDKDSKVGSGQPRVGMNANYTFSGSFAYEDIIYVGGGVRVDDASGKILAEYIPAEGDEKSPLGNTRTKAIEFSIPTEILGKPTKRWRFAVLVGAQDDHGGAGLGEFRTIEAEAKEWVGGGKQDPNDPNMYDVVLPPDDR